VFFFVSFPAKLGQKTSYHSMSDRNYQKNSNSYCMKLKFTDPLITQLKLNPIIQVSENIGNIKNVETIIQQKKRKQNVWFL